jgi:hypothetical protein
MANHLATVKTLEVEQALERNKKKKGGGGGGEKLMVFTEKTNAAKHS